MKNFLQSGNILHYIATAVAASGQVVALGETLGVSTKDVAVGAPGELMVTGVFTVPKVAGAVIAVGETLTWDSSAGAFDDNLAVPASGDITGAAAVAWESAGNGATSLAVKFTGAPGVRTA